MKTVAASASGLLKRSAASRRKSGTKAAKRESSRMEMKTRKKSLGKLEYLDRMIFSAFK
ncbi:hypothetical protein D9M68_639970 [compost metagenome]